MLAKLLIGSSSSSSSNSIDRSVSNKGRGIQDMIYMNEIDAMHLSYQANVHTFE